MTQTYLIRDYKYWAFISYSHEDKDICNWLHPALEKYVIPKELRRDGGLPKRLSPIFRDNDEMTAAPEYSAEIDKRLSQSLYLIVICSPNSAKSKYVNSEIKAYKTLGRSNNIIPLIVGGAPNISESSAGNAEECFPKALRFNVKSDGSYSTKKVNPIGPDIRFGNDSKKRALLKIIAPIIGVELEELEQRDRKQQIRRRLVSAVGTAIFATLLLTLTIGAYKYYNKLLEEEATAAIGLMKKGHEARNDKDWLKALFFYRKSLDKTDLHGARIGAMIAFNRLPKELAVLRGHQFPVTSLVISQDKQSIISGEASEDIFGHLFAIPSIRKWDLESGEELLVPPEHQFGIRDLAITRSNKIVILGNTGKIYEVDQKLRELPTIPLNEEASSRIAISDDGTIYAAVTEEKTIGIWNQETGDELASLTDYNSEISLLAFSPCAKYLAAIGDNIIYIWDWRNGVKKAELPGLYQTTLHVAFSPTGKTIVLGSYDSILIWYWPYPDDGPLKLALPTVVTALSYSPEGETLAVGGEDGIIYLWSDDRENYRTKIKGHEGAVTSLLFSPKGETLISGGEDSTVRIWQLPKCLYPLQSPLGFNAYNLAISPDNKTCATWDEDSPIQIFDRTSGKLITNLHDFKGEIQALAFSPHGLTIAAATETSIDIWDIANGKKSIINTDDDDVTTLAFSPDGNTIAAGSTDTIQLWDRCTLKKYGMLNGIYTAYINRYGEFISPSEEIYSPMTFEEHEAQEFWSSDENGLIITAIAFNHDGETIALSDIDGEIVFWSKNLDVTPKPIAEHRGYVSALTFSPDGSILASGGEDNTIRLWNWRDHEELAVFTRHECPVEALAFSPDGKQLLAVGEDDIAYKWDLGLDISSDPLKKKLDILLRLGTSLQIDFFYDVEPRISCEVLQERLHAAHKKSIPWLEDGGEAIEAGLIQQFQRQKCDEQSLWQSAFPKPSD